MSQENVELVHEGNRRFMAGDFSGHASRYRPDVVMAPPSGWPEPARSEGP
jgi:hypothetical protein